MWASAGRDPHKGLSLKLGADQKQKYIKKVFSKIWPKHGTIGVLQLIECRCYCLCALELIGSPAPPPHRPGPGCNVSPEFPSCR